MDRVREDRAAFRRPTNLSLDAQLVADAKVLGLNVSRACEVRPEAEIQAERNRRWKAENREATAAWAEYVETYGMPLERYRHF